MNDKSRRDWTVWESMYWKKHWHSTPVRDTKPYLSFLMHWYMNDMMLVIHPKDRTAAMLSVLYEGQNAQVVDDACSTKEVGVCCCIHPNKNVSCCLGMVVTMNCIIVKMIRMILLTKSLLSILMFIICGIMGAIISEFSIMRICTGIHATALWKYIMKSPSTMQLHYDFKSINNITNEKK